MYNFKQKANMIDWDLIIIIIILIIIIIYIIQTYICFTFVRLSTRLLSSVLLTMHILLIALSTCKARTVWGLGNEREPTHCNDALQTAFGYTNYPRTL